MIDGLDLSGVPYEENDEDHIEADRVTETDNEDGTRSEAITYVRDGLTAQDDRLALALSRGATMTDAAKYAGMSRRTAYRRCQKPAFKRLLAQLRGEHLERMFNFASTAGTEALEIVSDLMRSSDNEWVRLNAAQCLLANGQRLRELWDQQECLARLEAALKEHESVMEEHYGHQLPTCDA